MFEKFLRGLAWLFVGAFVFGALCYFGLPVPNNWELPFGDLSSIAVTKDGRIFCDSAFYSRVQLYSKTGKFITGWHVPGKHLHPLKLDDDESLVLETTSGVFKYDSSGALLKHDQRGHGLESTRIIKEDAQGNSYSVESRLLLPHVNQHSPEGVVRTVVSGPLHLVPFSGPLPCWIIVVTCMGLARFIRQTRIAREAATRASQRDSAATAE